MRTPSSPAAMLSMFLLGACTTVAVQTAAAPSEPAQTSTSDAGAGEAPDAGDDTLTPTVIPLDAAPRATSPNGKATIQHLALGHNAYVGRMRMDAGGAVPTHRDPTEEFIHVLEGSGTMTIDGEQFEIRPGTTIYMPANAEVSYQNGDAEMLAIQIFAGPEPAKKYDGWTPAQ